MLMKKEMELYLHIPFCAKKCDYCDFLSFPADKSIKREYVETLKQEIEEVGKDTGITGYPPYLWEEEPRLF